MTPGMVPGQLQCGRIYKDAEMGEHRGCIASADLLQCGRIYKDAEMLGAVNARISLGWLQCGRIYKDAEISGQTGRLSWRA